MKRNGRRAVAILVCMAMISVLLPFGIFASAAALNRPDDPVIVSGADVPILSGVAAADLVAFRYTGTAWEQVPVQVDERKVASYGRDVYNGVTGGYVTAKYANFENLVYCDPNTHVGADTNPAIDADDEIVFMARDTGVQAPADAWPEGVVQVRCAEIAVTDPLASDSIGYVYLYARSADGGLSGDAGRPYVNYTFKLQSGQSYKEAFPFIKLKNAAAEGRPEDSSFVTDNYTYHFADRWADDGLRITAGDATGVDILDRNKVAVMPSTEVPSMAEGKISGGSRTEDTFNGYTTDPAEGAFICNISGPVRAIRSYIGANSGPITQRDYYAYASRMDTVTFLRVHAMPSLMSFMDYSPEAAGMTYYRTSTPNGVTVDGNPDSVSSTFSETELLTGAQGSLSITTKVDHNLTSGVTVESYYMDDTTPDDEQYTGDGYAYASSGIWFSGNFTSMILNYLFNQDLEAAAEQYGISNTDPIRSSSAKSVTVSKSHYFRAPGMTFAEAQADTANVKTPLVYTAREIISSTAQSWGVTYDANGATLGNVPVDENVYLEGTVLTLPGNTGGLTRSGYQFVGWAASADATTPLTYYTIGNTPATLYAIWSRVADYSENGMSFIGGAPAGLFEDGFDYADNTTSKTLVDNGLWASQVSATSDGAFSKVVNGRFVFKGRTTGSSSSPKLRFDIDPTVVGAGSVVALSCVIRTGATGKTGITLLDQGAGGSALVSYMVQAQNGVIKSNKSASASANYTMGTGTYNDASGELVPVTIVMDFGNKKYSVYAKGTALLENETLPDWNEQNMLRVQLEGSYSVSATDQNWGEYDNISLRYGGLAMSEVIITKDGVTQDTLPKSGTIEVTRSVRNETVTDYNAMMIVAVCDKNGSMKHLKIVPVDAKARTQTDLKAEITLNGTEDHIVVYWWKDLFSMQQLLKPYTF